MKIHANSSAATAGITVLAPVAWGTTYVTTTELLPAGRPLLVATMRVVPAALALLAAGTITSRWRPRGADWLRTATLAVFNFGFFFPLLSVAVYRLPGGVAAAVGGMQPLLVCTLSWLLAGRRPRINELAIGCVAVLGVALVAIRPGANLDAVGLLAASAANVSFAIGVVLTKRFPAPPNRVASTGWQLLMGGAILLPLTAIIEGAPPALTGRNLAGFAYLSMVGTALAFIVWFNGVRRLPAVAPPLLGLAAPITGAVLGWVILGQSLSPLQLTGFAITVGAIAYGATRRSVVAVDPRHIATDRIEQGQRVRQVGEHQIGADVVEQVDAVRAGCHQRATHPVGSSTRKVSWSVTDHPHIARPEVGACSRNPGEGQTHELGTLDVIGAIPTELESQVVT
jgi:probable blue pigment (indigoidine) exporter